MGQNYFSWEQSAQAVSSFSILLNLMSVRIPAVFQSLPHCSIYLLFAGVYNTEESFFCMHSDFSHNSIHGGIEQGREEHMGYFKVLLLAMGVFFFSAAGHAELAKQGSGSYRGAKSGTLNILVFEKGRIQANFDETGVVVEAPENSPFFNASFHAVGTFYSNKGEMEGSGGIKYTRPNGDTFFGVFKFGGIHGRGPATGVVEILGGTGECAGMTGEIELLPRPKVEASTQAGRYQSIAIANISWNVP